MDKHADDYPGELKRFVSLKEDGIETILINSNLCNNQRDRSCDGRSYLPAALTTKSILKILGSTQNRCGTTFHHGGKRRWTCIEADEKDMEGFWHKIVGVNVNDQYHRRPGAIPGFWWSKIPMAPSCTANSYLKGKKLHKSLVFPLVIRLIIYLGWSRTLLYKGRRLWQAFKTRIGSFPIHEVMIDKGDDGVEEYTWNYATTNDNSYYLYYWKHLDHGHPYWFITAPAMTFERCNISTHAGYGHHMMRSIGNFAGVAVQFAVESQDERKILLPSKLIRAGIPFFRHWPLRPQGIPIAKIAAKLAIGTTWMS